MIDEQDAIHLVLGYVKSRHPATFRELHATLREFESGWLATLERNDGVDLIGAEAIVVNRDSGELSTFAGGMSPRRIIRLINDPNQE